MWIDDDILMRCEEAMALDVFVPPHTVVVCGAANDEKVETRENFCRERGIPILKRYGGGGTVVLYPGTIVVSLGAWVKRHFHNSHYFRLINESVAQCLMRKWPTLSLAQAGISDIVSDKRKVCGTSMFRSRNYLLYQASLLVELDIDLIEGCLAFPSRVPDYRANRSHREFLTDLASLDNSITVRAVAAHLQAELATCLIEQLAGELIAADPSQIPHVKARAERGRQADSWKSLAETKK